MATTSLRTVLHASASPEQWHPSAPFSSIPLPPCSYASHISAPEGVKIENPPEHEPYKGSASPLQYFASAALYDLFYARAYPTSN